MIKEEDDKKKEEPRQRKTFWQWLTRQDTQQVKNERYAYFRGQLRKKKLKQKQSVQRKVRRQGASKNDGVRRYAHLVGPNFVDTIEYPSPPRKTKKDILRKLTLLFL